MIKLSWWEEFIVQAAISLIDAACIESHESNRTGRHSGRDCFSAALDRRPGQHDVNRKVQKQRAEAMQQRFRPLCSGRPQFPAIPFVRHGVKRRPHEY